MSDRKPSRHEHEQGAPLTDGCDTWCRGKYEGWKAQQADRLTPAQVETLKSKHETEKIARRLSRERTGGEALWVGFLLDAYREYYGLDESGDAILRDVQEGT